MWRFKITIFLIPLIFVFGQDKDQILFQHSLHVDDMELACQECHVGVREASGPSWDIFPKMATCEECHDGDTADDACEYCHSNPDDPLMNFDEVELHGILVATGFRNIEHRMVERSREHEMTSSSAREWWHKDIAGVALPGHQSPYELLRHYLSQNELDACVELFCSKLDGNTITFKSKQVYMWGEK